MKVGKEPIDLGLFDNVILCAVLEHLKHPHKILNNLKENLSPTVRMIITPPPQQRGQIRF